VVKQSKNNPFTFSLLIAEVWLITKEPSTTQHHKITPYNHFTPLQPKCQALLAIFFTKFIKFRVFFIIFPVNRQISLFSDFLKTPLTTFAI